MPQSGANALRITRLRLQNWLNFVDVEVCLARRAFFVGPNASGKSNLLDALRFVRDLVTTGGGLQEAVRARGGVTAIRCLAARRFPQVSVEIDVGTEAHPTLWQYELGFTGGTGRTRQPEIGKEQIRRSGKTVLSRPDGADEEDPERRRQTALEQISANKEFRELANFFSTIRYLHVVPQIIRDPRRGVGTDDPFGGDLLERINTTSPRKRDARLRRMQEALQIAVPQLAELQLETDEKGIPHLKAKYQHWRPQGAWQREAQFSDGTLRLLGLIWALQEAGGPLLLEEPELSLHPAVVRELPRMIHRATRSSGRQTFLTTHSADLLQDEGIGLDEVHLLVPGDNGTDVKTGASIADVRRMVEQGVPLGEAMLPRAQAPNAAQLSLFDLVV